MSYSPELSEYYSEEEKTVQPVSTPTIKLKLKLNPSASSSSFPTEKKQKQKKKHKKKHSKVKLEDHNNDYSSNFKNEHTVHPMAGGKRPYALIQEQQEMHNEYEDDDDNEDDDDDNYSESYHPTDTNKPKPESFYSEDDDNDYQHYKQPRFLSPSAQLDYPDYQGPRLGRPPKEKTRRSSSTKSGSSATEKPKKRGRPTNKAKAAALLAQIPPKIPENPKRDLKAILTKLLDNLQKRDVYGFFLDPVDPNFVPDYLKVIKTPMAFTTMQTKLEDAVYTNVDDFRQDFNLIVSNAKLYNAVNTIYWKSADKLYEVGSKLIDKAEKQYDEEMSLAAAETSIVGEIQEGKKLSVGRKDSFIKEEDVDIMGIDTNTLSLQKHNRQGFDTASIDIASSRAIVPNKSYYNKKKKKKTVEMGTVYAPDGSLHAVSGVPDPAALLPTEGSFCEPPQLITSNPNTLPSVFYLNRQSSDDAYRNKHQVHSAHFLDYGPFTTLGHQPPGAFYTAQDASYIYPLFGDDRGEAYVKSLWQFLEVEQHDKQLIDIVKKRSDYLTRGAWSVLNETLDKKNDYLTQKDETTENDKQKTISTEFGEVDVSSIINKLLSETNQE
ncbi:hypothetical protein G6F56_000679 [Rhizopus delemar]|nr:hypothetical protein G6F56_000679 [Rhizopus delemar]